MTKQNIKGAAPMPRKEEDIKSSMKLYTYLVCISGLATYPENTRMFRHKNLILTHILKAIGITDKTAKGYLYQLEKRGLVIYNGEIKDSSLTDDELKSIEEKVKKKSAGAQETEREKLIGALLWKKRNQKEKDGVYYIPRPNIWTPVPEKTLQQLNEVFNCSEEEMKIYLLCCNYRDICSFEGKKFKNLTFEYVRDALGKKDNSSILDQKIRRALIFLKGIGLIEYTEKLVCNAKGFSRPCFKLEEVYYYINYEIQTVQEDVEDQDLKEVIDRINEIMSLELEKKDKVSC